MSVEMNTEQRAALDARGVVFVSAGAGSGKTRVMVERFVEAVTDGGLDISSILVVTFTERAAGELSSRIRARLVELDRHDLARSLDGAWIDTIHGYCRRLLAAHPLRAGIDPRFRVLSEEHAAVLRFESFGAALRLFVGPDDPERWRVVTAYGAEELQKMLFAAFESLRAAGQSLVLAPWPLPSLGDLVRTLHEEAAALAADPKVTVKQAEAALAAVDVAAVGAAAERLVELRSIRAVGDRAKGFEAARKEVIAAAWSALAERDRAQFQALLDLFAECYAKAKEREAAVDYTDLELRARDVLHGNEALRRAERDRFQLVMVDEFQDTNRLQAELLDLVTAESGADVLFVGDELQSIYGFRHADVAVYRERRTAAAHVVDLTLNYRSRPEVLDAVNEIFAGEFQDAFTPLVAASAADDQPRHPFEVLVTDGVAAEEETGESGRQSEARHVARRIRELVDAGEATPGDIVLLFAKSMDASLFEDEIRASGIPVLRLTRANYWGQQQVADLLAYLRLLRNRTDDRALLTVLASPFVGVTNDALMLIRDVADTALWHGIEPTLPTALSAHDRLLLRAFTRRYAELLEVSDRVSLEELCERIVVAHDYDLAILAQPDGERRFANVRKLVRLASEFESLRGPDLEGFVSFIAQQAELGTRIEDAVSLEEGADAVRLMTIHGAKGLEFPVVILADTGRRRPSGPRSLCLSDGRFGFKVADPVTGEPHGTPAHDAVRAVRDASQRSEDLRLQYVGMTRAMERLIVSGSIPKARGDETPLGWLIDRLDLASTIESIEGDGAVELERGRARVLVRVDRGQDPIVVNDAVVEEEEVAVTVPQLALFGAAASGPGLVLPPLADSPIPPAHWPDRLSHSAIERFEKCPYRFYAEREGALRERPRDEARPVAADGTALAANERGSAAHRLLESAVAEAWRETPTDLEARVREWFPTAAPADLALVRAHIEAFLASPLAERLAAEDSVHVEQEFVLEHDGVLVNGRLDVFQRTDAEALVLDFKTNALHGRDPAEVAASEYAGQRDLYALAALRAGAERVEVVYQFLEAAESPVVARFDRSHEPALAARLSAVIEGIRTSTFPAKPSPLACRECPALGRVCRGTGTGLPVAAR